jgi:hypothetical protein
MISCYLSNLFPLFAFLILLTAKPLSKPVIIEENFTVFEPHSRSTAVRTYP